MGALLLALLPALANSLNQEPGMAYNGTIDILKKRADEFKVGGKTHAKAVRRRLAHARARLAALQYAKF